MVELADALDSKSSGSDTVWVRFPPPAPKKMTLTFVRVVFLYRRESNPERAKIFKKKLPVASFLDFWGVVGY